MATKNDQERAEAIGVRYNDRYEGLTMQGCGMDAGFEAVYTLARVLFPDGFGCIGEGCPSNDHANGDRNYTPHGKTSDENNGAPWEHWHADGGYALRQRWI